MTSANLSQSKFRGRSDTGAVDGTPGWIAPLSTNFVWNTNADFRLRFLIQNTTTGTPTSGMTVKLQCNKNGGAFQDVTSASTIAKSSTTASSSADETAIVTALLAGTGTYTQGHYSNDGAGDTGVTMVGSGNTEYEFGLQLVSSSVAVGDAIGFKVVTVSGSTITATLSPSITVGNPVGWDQEGNKHPARLPSLTSSRYAASRSKSEFAVYSTWLIAGWEMQSVQPPRQRSERGAAVMVGDGVIQAPVPAVAAPAIAHDVAGFAFAEG